MTWRIILFSAMIALAINMGLIFAYCRIMPYIENRFKEHKNDAKSDKEEIGLYKKHIKLMLSTIAMNYLYGWIRYCVIKVGNIPSNRIRNILYRFIFNAKITSKTVINGGCEIRSPWNLHAGNCIIMNNCILDARSKIYIKDNVVFGQGVHVWTEEHDVDDPMFSVLERNKGPVYIHERAWICSDSTILPKTNVGEGAVLASRGVATKDLKPYSIYAGVPAKLLRERNRELEYKLSGKPHWHFY